MEGSLTRKMQIDIQYFEPCSICCFLLEQPEKITADELAADMERLPGWRREKVLSYRFHIDRVLCAEAYLLLKDALYHKYGINESLIFDFNAHGKPLLKGFPTIHFNLSHCHKGILCTTGDFEVGCDIEEIPDCLDMELCKYCFNDDEVRQILSASDPCTEFTIMWTKKEALVKLSGEGLTDDVRNLLSSEKAKEVQFISEAHPDKGYALSVATTNLP